MGFFDSIKSKLKGKKGVQEGLDKAKPAADKAIDKVAKDQGIDTVRNGAVDVGFFFPYSEER